MDQPLTYEEVCRVIGRLILEHELAIARQQTLYEVRLKQAEAKVADLQAKLGALRGAA